MTQNRVNLALLCAGLVAVPMLVMAQPAGDGLPSSRGGAPPSNFGRIGQDAPRKPPALARLTPKPDPRQRLDTGALLCRTEADLQQHEAAITAQLNGNEGAEPTGCRRVRRMVSVSVLDRHGPSRTQVRLVGPPEETGWTDTAVRGE